ncbi:MAG TPA: archease [Vulgatibacter sp.]|nr:archease [Vulgatibacter sp.]
MIAPGHRIEGHTSEVRLALQAPTLRELYEQAAAALSGVMCLGSRPAPGARPLDVRLEARDAAALLVDWLDELIYQVEQTGLVFPAPKIHVASARRLHATITGEEPVEWKTPVKAATFHDLRVEEGDDGFRAVVVVDV